MRTTFSLIAGALLACALMVSPPAHAEKEGCAIAKQKEFKAKCETVYNGTYNNDCSYDTNNHTFTYSCTVNGQTKTYTDRGEVAPEKQKPEQVQ